MWPPAVIARQGSQIDGVGTRAFVEYVPEPASQNMAHIPCMDSLAVVVLIVGLDICVGVSRYCWDLLLL